MLTPETTESMRCTFVGQNGRKEERERQRITFHQLAALKISIIRKWPGWRTRTRNLSGKIERIASRSAQIPQRSTNPSCSFRVSAFFWINWPISSISSGITEYRRQKGETLSFFRGIDERSQIEKRRRGREPRLCAASAPKVREKHHDERTDFGRVFRRSPSSRRGRERYSYRVCGVPWGISSLSANMFYGRVAGRLATA